MMILKNKLFIFYFIFYLKMQQKTRKIVKNVKKYIYFIKNKAKI